jgi:hypothetical protein
MRNLETINGEQLAAARAVEQIERLQNAVETVIKESRKRSAWRVTLIAGGTSWLKMFLA